MSPMSGVPAAPGGPAVRATPAFLALVGPTASGKTALSIAVARALDGEIVCMDSRQVYRGMDIGTAKATKEERAAVPHHGLDLLEPGQRYSAGQFARDARAWITGIRARGRVPLLVGGSGFFLRALLAPIFAEPAMDRERREALRRWLAAQPRPTLERWARRLDPARVALAAEGGPQRLSRTLEVALLTGRALSDWHRSAPPDGEGLDGLVVRLDLARDEMDRRIATRARLMVERGLVREVEGLLAKGCGVAAPGMTGTGYREVVAYLLGEATLEETIERITGATRRYARRQLTWMRNQLPPDTVTVDAGLPLAEQVNAVVETWRDRGGRAPRRTAPEEAR